MVTLNLDGGVWASEDQEKKNKQGHPGGETWGGKVFEVGEGP